MDIVENSSFQHLRIRPKTGIFRNAVKIFLSVYARKWTDSLNPKKFNCGGGHICVKVKTPYGQKRGGGIWRRTGGEPSGARAPPNRPQPRPPPRRFPRPAYTLSRRFFARSFPHKRCGKNSAPACTLARRQKPPRRAPICGRLLEKTSAAKTPHPNRLAEQKTALLCAFLPFSLFCKAFSKFS